MNKLTKIMDRILFHSFYKYYYKRIFKSYGNNIRWGAHFERLVIPSSIRISCPHMIEIGDNCRFDEGTFIQCSEQGGGISIGAGTRINAHGHIQAYSKISIGEKVLMAPFSLINSGKHTYCETNKNFIDGAYEGAGEIFIDSGAWLGHSVHVLGGARIGKGSIVASHSVVKGHFNEELMLAGAPAVIKRALNA